MLQRAMTKTLASLTLLSLTLTGGRRNLFTCCGQLRHVAIYPHFELRNSNMNSIVNVNRKVCKLSLVNVVELLVNAREAWNAMKVSGILLSYPNLPNKHVLIWQSPFKGCKNLHNTPMCSWETSLSTTTKIPLVHVLIPNICNIAGSERIS